LRRDARLVLSTARLSTHRTGEFAVLGSARGAYIGVSGPLWSRGRWVTDALELAARAVAQAASRERATV
ncbi:hypothetical protein FB107DRAFT_225278, partial [Schizophyllum commune]